MARIQADRRSFVVAAQNTLAATQRVLVRVAKREHARVMQTDPKPAMFSRFIDGKRGLPEEAVRPQGVILYTYPRIEQVAQYAMEVLFDLSPVLSGEYRLSHRLFLNGVPVTDLKDWKPGDEVSIGNSVQYARKIELGVMTMRVAGTAQVYTQAVKRVRSRYGNIASVTFTYRAIVAARQVDQQLAASSGQPWWLGGAAARVATGAFEKTLGRTLHNRSDLRYPTLLIREL